MQLDLLRSFFSIVEHGSLNKAAERLGVSQSTLTRQVHSLEAEAGGRLFERSTSGVALTAAGHALAAGMKPLLANLDRVLDETRKLARGKSAQLRVGYLASAAADYLHPALAALRKSTPNVKVKLVDLSPGEQLAALRAGRIDLALLGSCDATLVREFYVRRLASLPVMVAVSEGHRFSGRPWVNPADLRGELFVGAAEQDMPGYNRWVARLCRRAGFRPRFVEDAESLTHGLAMVVSDGAVSLLPEYTRTTNVPGVFFVPLRDPHAKWELLVAWQRGAMTAPVKAMLEALPKA